MSSLIGSESVFLISFWLLFTGTGSFAFGWTLLYFSVARLGARGLWSLSLKLVGGEGVASYFYFYFDSTFCVCGAGRGAKTTFTGFTSRNTLLLYYLCLQASFYVKLWFRSLSSFRYSLRLPVINNVSFRSYQLSRLSSSKNVSDWLYTASYFLCELSRTLSSPIVCSISSTPRAPIFS